MHFRVGQKVVCVDASPSAVFRRWCGDVPVKGQVYTVRGIRVSTHPMWTGALLLLLAEIKNVTTDGDGYRAFRFRPVVERKTDISVFTAMLKETHVKEQA